MRIEMPVENIILEAEKPSGIGALLRCLGAVIILASAGAFLVQKWGGMDHLGRFYAFLAYTAALTAAGFFCGLRVRESKSARTLLGISATLVPVNFCVLGGLIYSLFAVVPRGLPKYFIWVAPDPGMMAIAGVVSAVVLIPISAICFTTLARERAGLLTTAFLIGCTALLIPTRDPGLTAMLGMAAVAYAAAVIQVGLLRGGTMRTAEAAFARAMLFAPAVLIFGRTFVLYSHSSALVAAIFGSAALLLFMHLPRYAKNPQLAGSIQRKSLPMAFIAATFFGAAIVSTYHLTEQYFLPFAVIPFAAVALVMARAAMDRQELYRATAINTLAVGTLLQMFLFPSVGASAVLLLMGIVLTAVGYERSRGRTLGFGLVLVVWSIGFTLSRAAFVANCSPWVLLGVIGALTIVGASYLERYYPMLRARFSTNRTVKTGPVSKTPGAGLAQARNVR